MIAALKREPFEVVRAYWIGRFERAEAALRRAVQAKDDAAADGACEVIEVCEAELRLIELATAPPRPLAEWLAERREALGIVPAPTLADLPFPNQTGAAA